MSDEAREALTRLGMKLGAYANMGEHTVLEAAAWGIVLLDLHEVERGFAELEDYKRLAEKRLDLWSEDYHKLKDELKNLRDYMRKFEPFKTWAEEDAVKISCPASEIYIGVDKAHDESEETVLVFVRRNEDGSVTVLAELRGEAAEYVAELENNFNDLSHRFSCILENATGGKMSKTNYTKEAMYREIDGHIQDLCDDAVKELKDSLPKRTLRWDGERRDGEGAYVCIYCNEELPRFGAIVHKADCIQATMF